MQRWAGRVAIVTGTSSGIGAAIARQLVENAMKVVGVARREDKVQVCSHYKILNNLALSLFAIFKNEAPKINTFAVSTE